MYSLSQFLHTGKYGRYCWNFSCPVSSDIFSPIFLLFRRIVWIWSFSNPFSYVSLALLNSYFISSLSSPSSKRLLICIPYESWQSNGSGIADTLFPKCSFRESENPSGIFRRPSKSSEYAISSDL